MQFIRFITAGNVDDGKSTLIGRLLYDSHAISNDILENIQTHHGAIHFAHLTDGLKAEREQGITIDVAYRYFSTEKRKFIIADCPGHKEYTRNMITGASHSDVAIVMIDATRGITEQTKRHTFIADLLNIPCIIFCINKMDMVLYQEEVFQNICEQIKTFNFTNHHQVEYVPVSALYGDNVVHRSKNMSWYNGPTLLYVLENFELPQTTNILPACMQVQYTCFQNNQRYFFGTGSHASFAPHQKVLVYPTLQKNAIQDLFVFGESSVHTIPNQPIAITLQEEMDIQRGYWLVAEYNDPTIYPEKVLYPTTLFSAICFWLDESTFLPNKRYFIQHHSFRTYLKCLSVDAVFDLDALNFHSVTQAHITTNTIFRAQFQTAHPLLWFDYTKIPPLGSFIIIDETSYKTVGAGIVGR